MSTYSCADVDEDNVSDGDDFYMRADYSVSCETTRYKIAVVIASISVIIYPGMLPHFISPSEPFVF